METKNQAKEEKNRNDKTDKISKNFQITYVWRCDHKPWLQKEAWNFEYTGYGKQIEKGTTSLLAIQKYTEIQKLRPQ